MSSGPDAVRQQLTRMLQSRTFANAPVLRRLAAHIVERTLEGRADELKEYAIGLDVFERRPDFDPRVDTIVRVQARRLRAKLGEYYDCEGRADPLLIELPKGHYAAVFRAASHQASEPHAAGLPAPRTNLVGRSVELAAVKGLLTDDHVRLVTLAGAGGSGKTRVALRAAADAAVLFPGGVHFIALGAVTSADAVGPAISQVLRLRHTGGRPLSDALRDHVRVSVQAPTLLVLDNFEQLLPAATLLVALLDAAAPLKMLVTSREVLHVYGEHVHFIAPLALPDAIDLFAQRARALNPAFALTEDNAADVAEICARLDGLPLALELAAARTTIIPPAAMRARLEARLDLLTCGGRDLPNRQQALRNTLDWSYGLLNAAEQRLFRRLPVFAGGCTLEGAEAVCNTKLDLGIDVLTGVGSLVDKNLLVGAGDTGGEVRFAMLETVREYAFEQLAAAGEQEETRRNHAAWCLVLAEEGNTLVRDADRAAWLARCDAEHDNHRAAFDYLTAAGHSEWAYRLGLALYSFWERRDHLIEGRRRLEALLTMPGTACAPEAWAKIASFAGSLANIQGDFDAGFQRSLDALHAYRAFGDPRGVIAQLSSLGASEHLRGNVHEARRWFERALAACREVDDPTAVAAALSNLAEAVSAEGAFDDAAALLEEASSLFRAAGDRTGEAWSLNHLGDVARARGDVSEARRLYEQGANLFAAIGDGWGSGRSSLDLGYLACDAGDHETALALFSDALTVFVQLDHKRGIASVLEGLAGVASFRGRHDRAMRLAGAAVALRRTIGAEARKPREMDDLRELASQQLAPAVVHAHWLAGCAMPFDEAIEYARHDAPPAAAIGS